MHVIPVLLALALLALISVARGQSTEAEFAVLLKQRAAAAVETLARQRLQAKPTDDVALWAWGRVVSGDPAKRAEACVAARPQSARCHHVLAGPTARWRCPAASATA